MSQKNLPSISVVPQEETPLEQSIEVAHQTIDDKQSEEEKNYDTMIPLPLSQPNDIDSTATSRVEMELPFRQRKLELQREANQKNLLREEHLQKLVAQTNQGTEAETCMVLEQLKVRQKNLVARLQRKLEVALARELQ